MKKHLKKLIATLLSSALLLSGMVVNAKNVNDFGDVRGGDWFYEYVADVSQKELMTGLNENTFGPSTNLSRGQFVTILYRISESPNVDYTSLFTDVPDGQFYSAPIIWANTTGIATGYGGDYFGVSDNITREQMATMLYRYAAVTEGSVSVTGDYNAFPDGYKVSDFASEAMKWAIGEGIISGNQNGTLAPQDPVSRAVCATMIARFTGYSSSSSSTSGDNPTYGTGYVLNTSTKKFHYSSCRHVRKIAPENYATSNDSRDHILAQGYEPCGVCNP